MSRPVRIEFPNALYHVTARGDRREDIFEDDVDRQAFLEIFGQVVKQFNWLCYAWCLMDNHYHLLIQTPYANLSKGMRQLNGVYTQSSNRRHARVGHLFQGRFKAILVDSDAYLLELARYVVLNPVRAGMVRKPDKWAWSSYRASMGLAPAQPFLAVDGLLAQFAKRRTVAQARYAQFVADGIKAPSPWQQLKGQVFLGDERFVKKMQARMGKQQRADVQIPISHRRAPAPSLAQIEQRSPDRNTAIVKAHATGAYSYQQIAEHFGLHFTTVGKVVRRGG
jgi:REP element-mobilizing transposase RayT